MKKLTPKRMIEMLKENYSLCELEERVEATVSDLEDGLEVWIENNFETVEEMLKEDLHLGE